MQTLKDKLIDEICQVLSENYTGLLIEEDKTEVKIYAKVGKLTTEFRIDEGNTSYYIAKFSEYFLN